MKSLIFLINYFFIGVNFLAVFILNHLKLNLVNGRKSEFIQKIRSKQFFYKSKYFLITFFIILFLLINVLYNSGLVLAEARPICVETTRTYIEIPSLYDDSNTYFKAAVILSGAVYLKTGDPYLAAESFFYFYISALLCDLLVAHPPHSVLGPNKVF